MKNEWLPIQFTEVSKESADVEKQIWFTFEEMKWKLHNLPSEEKHLGEPGFYTQSHLTSWYVLPTQVALSHLALLLFTSFFLIGH